MKRLDVLLIISGVCKMKSLKIIKNLGGKERKALLENVRKELIKLYAQRAVGSVVESPGKIKALRKTIARIFTLEANTNLAEKGGQK